MHGTTAAFLAAAALAGLGALHLVSPERAWRLYRRPNEPEDSTRFTLRLLGAALLAFEGLVGAVAYVVS